MWHSKNNVSIIVVSSRSQELVVLVPSSISVIKFSYQCDLKKIELSRFHFSSSKIRSLHCAK